jgi:hypothetical protein
VDLRSLLQNLGLGEEVVRGLAEMGVGPLGPTGGAQEADQQQQQQQGQGWQQASGGTFRWVLKIASIWQHCLVVNLHCVLCVRRQTVGRAQYHE